MQPRCDFELKRPLHGGMHARIERFRSALNLAGFHNRRLQAGEVSVAEALRRSFPSDRGRLFASDRIFVAGV